MILLSSVFAVEYMVIGVSGGLQDGFPDHVKTDYRSGEPDEVKAILLGRALVRGTKAYLDVMQPGWRQYTPEPDQPLINSVNLVSGCAEHANQYWIYAVDSRQALSILNHEPRFLSVTPDTAMVDLTAAETDETVRVWARRQIAKQGKADQDRVALPIVVAVWYNAPSYVPSPPIAVHADGTMVTNFPGSLAKWAGVDDADRTVGCDDADQEQCINSEQVLTAQQRYWDGIRAAIRHAEADPLTEAEAKANGPPFACRSTAPLGVTHDQARINYPFLAQELVQSFADCGYHLDLKAAKLTATA